MNELELCSMTVDDLKLYSGFYIVTEKKKICSQKLYSREEAEEKSMEIDCCYAAVLNNDVLYYDFEGPKAALVLQFIIENKIKCKVLETNRGYHVIFKSIKHSVPKSTKAVLNNGQTANIYTGWDNDYEVIYYTGSYYDVVYDAGEYKMPPVEFLPEGMEATEEPEFQRKPFNIAEYYNEKRTQLKHNDVSIYMIKNGPIINYEGFFLVYDEEKGIYTDGREVWMKQLLPDCTIQQRKEIEADIRLNCHKKVNTRGDAAKIAVKNGILDLKTGELLPKSPKYHILNALEWNYNPDAYDEEIDRFLDSVVCGNKALRANLEEFLGLTMYPSNEFGQNMLFIIGDKANGKSTFQKLAGTFFGSDNYTTTDIQQATSRFGTQQLTHKLLVNAGDIDGKYIEDCSWMKKLTGDDKVTADVKCKDMTEFTNYAKFIFGCNQIPRMKDDSGAMDRRVIIIPFKNKFKKDLSFMARLLDENTIEQKMSYLMNLALAGFQRLWNNGEFTPSDEAEEQMEAFQERNRPVLGWIREEFENFEDEVNEAPAAQVYEMYKDYCEDYGITAMSKKIFNNFLRENYKIDIVKKGGMMTIIKR